MYYDFFGFREPPFSIAPDPRYLYLSERHKEALAHLMYGVQGQGGFIVITGEVGTGKTTVSRCFIENAPAHVDIALILNPRLSAQELLSAICDELEIPHEPGATIKQLVDLINQDLLSAHAAGRHKVLMIDEAQNLSAEVLEQLRLLTNLETAEKKLLQIVLLGQPELQQILSLPELRQLNQRVTARYHLDAINRAELPAYLKYRLGVAGMRGDIFSMGAINRLYKESQGIPRLINLISDRALLGAYAEGEHEITTGHIKQAAKEVRGGGSTPVTARKGSGRGAQYLMLVASVLVAIMGTVWLVDRWPLANTLELALEPENGLGGAVEREAEAQEATVEASEDASDAGPPDTGPAREALAAFQFHEDRVDAPGAFRLLFGLWGKSYRAADNPIACDYARTVGLGCLERQGTRRSLEFLNRPAMLQLRNQAGEVGYAVLKSLNGDLAEVVVPGGEAREMSFASLENFWFGEYRVLWRLPEYMTGDNFYASGNGEQLWIGARMMELADQYTTSTSENGRVKRMSAEQQVRWYQEIRGLTVDGIAGAMTVIQINNDLGAPGPRLVPRISSSKG
ncbi:AAA family ATPase [Marinobacter pelagius]|uniref:AAA family ATPase n=1 Tax=Marinobacter sp. C7 TaxID=2951363 RepID=UPI001EF0D4CD|nr:AAA family ATPase [Marinobacter sp. C7]MCG7199516.1 AAA family ATPase [Marinobacter sp. C7]